MCVCMSLCVHRRACVWAGAHQSGRSCDIPVSACTPVDVCGGWRVHLCEWAWTRSTPLQAWACACTHTRLQGLTLVSLSRDSVHSNLRSHPLPGPRCPRLPSTPTNPQSQWPTSSEPLSLLCQPDPHTQAQTQVSGPEVSLFLCGICPRSRRLGWAWLCLASPRRPGGPSSQPAPPGASCRHRVS